MLAFILSIKWNLVVRGRRFLCTYSTVLYYYCTTVRTETF